MRDGRRVSGAERMRRAGARSHGRIASWHRRRWRSALAWQPAIPGTSRWPGCRWTTGRWASERAVSAGPDRPLVASVEPAHAGRWPPTVSNPMGRRRMVCGATALAAFAMIAGGGSSAWAAAEGGPLAQTCGAIDQRLGAACHGDEQLISDASAICRYPGAAPDESCNTPLGPQATRAAVDAFQGSWVDRALRLQYDLEGDVGFVNAPWVGTHNSFNSVAEMGPTLSDTDANQQLSLVDQLRIDVRSLELDVHWSPSVASGGANAPVVCHAEGYDAGAAAIDQRLGDLVYRPAGPGCTALPLDLTRDQVLAAGKQVVIVSGCGVGSAWPGVAFDWSAHKETRPQDYSDFPACGSDFDRATYDSTLVRYFE